MSMSLRTPAAIISANFSARHVQGLPNGLGIMGYCDGVKQEERVAKWELVAALRTAKLQVPLQRILDFEQA